MSKKLSFLVMAVLVAIVVLLTTSMLVSCDPNIFGKIGQSRDDSPPSDGEAGDQTGGETGGQTGGETGGQTGGETGDETGGQTGGQTGGETGDETGGETGGEPGGETGDEPGGETGGEPGGETGDEPGGEAGAETGDEPGGETGGEPGGETGDETGGETGGEPGGETGDEPGGETGDEPGGETGDEPGGETGGEPGGEAGGEPGGETGDEPGGETGGEPGGETGDEPGGEAGAETGDEPGGETGGEPGGETGAETGGEPGGETGGEPSGETGDEPGGETGAETGDEPGGETGEETGGETGEETGGETGDEPGGETGGEPGEETGDEPGGETGGEPGGEAGEETGGETGDEPGSETGDEPGGEAGGETGGETSEPGDADVAAAKAVADAFKFGTVDQDMFKAVEAAKSVVGVMLEDTPGFRAALQGEIGAIEEALAAEYDVSAEGCVSYNFSGGGLFIGLKLPVGGTKALSAELMQIPDDGNWRFQMEIPDEKAESAGRASINADIDKDEHGNVLIDSTTQHFMESGGEPDYQSHDTVILGDEGLEYGDTVMTSEFESGDTTIEETIGYFDCKAPEGTKVSKARGVAYNIDGIGSDSKFAGELVFMGVDDSSVPRFASVGEQRYADRAEDFVTVYDFTANPKFLSEIENLPSFELAESQGIIPVSTRDLIASLEKVEPKPYIPTVPHFLEVGWAYPSNKEGEPQLGVRPDFESLLIGTLIKETPEEAGQKLKTKGFEEVDGVWVRGPLSVRLIARITPEAEPAVTGLSLNIYKPAEEYSDLVDSWQEKLIPIWKNSPDVHPGRPDW